MTLSRERDPVHLAFDIDRDQNRELLTDLFAAFEIVEFSGAVPDGTDLCIVDERAFQRSPERFVTWKAEEGSLFAPVAVLSEPTTADPWQSFDESLLAEADDILQIPVSKAEFTSRIEKLLTMREFTSTLSEQKQFSELVFQSSPLAKLVIEQDGTVVQANERAGEMFDVDPASIAGTVYNESDWVAVDDEGTEIPADELPFSRVFETNKPVYGREYTIRHPQGPETNVSVNVAPVRDASGSIEYVVATLEDITVRRAQSARLERQVDLFRQAQEIASLGAWEYDVQTGEQWVSRGVDRILGVQSGADIPIEEHFEFYHPTDRPVIREAFDRAVEDGEPYDLELRIARPDGEERWVRTLGEPQGDDGEVRRVRGAIQDITDRKKREVERKRMSNAVESAPIGITLSDPDREDNPLIYVNEGFLDMTGYTREEALGRNCRFLQGTDTLEEHVRTVRKAIDAEKTVTVTLRNYRKDGSLFWNRLTVSPVYDEDGSLTNFIGFQEDVSDLMQQQRQLGILDRYLRHNLRNSLNVVQGHAELVQQEADPPVAEYGATIERTSTTLLQNVEKERAITELLRSPLNPTTIELMPLLRSMVEEFERTYSHATVSLSGPDEVWVDALPKLAEALGELIENAIQHTDSESPTIDVAVEVGADTARVIVSDSGPGIPEMEVNVLVNRTAENPTYHGQGFGLWMVYLIVQHSGGNVTFEGSEEGTTVTVELPLADEDATD